jgi:uncharacterized membrane protein (UPF0136 family)
MPAAPIFFLIFGAIAELLGILGWVRAKSKASLIAGVVSGLLLTVAGILGLVRLESQGLWLGGGVSLLLLGRFLPAFLKSKALYPAGIMSALSLVGVVLAALHLFR